MTDAVVRRVSDVPPERETIIDVRTDGNWFETKCHV